MVDKFTNINIHATQDNFGETGGTATQSLRGLTTGYVSYTASNETGQGNYCYEVSLDVTSNNFVYSLPKTNGGNHQSYYPELVLRIWKEQKTGPISGLSSVDPETTGTEYTDELFFADSGSLPYVSDGITVNSVCDTDGAGEKTSTCKSSQQIKGYDITMLGYNSTEGEKFADVTSKRETSVKIPAGSVGKNYAGTDYKHKITVSGSKGQGKDELTNNDVWKLAVTFVNYSDSDITAPAVGYGTTDTEWKKDHGESTSYGDQNINTEKTFTATLKFNPLGKCED